MILINMPQKKLNDTVDFSVDGKEMILQVGVFDK